MVSPAAPVQECQTPDHEAMRERDSSGAAAVDTDRKKTTRVQKRGGEGSCINRVKGFNHFLSCSLMQ